MNTFSLNSQQSCNSFHLQRKRSRKAQQCNTKAFPGWMMVYDGQPTSQIISGYNNYSLNSLITLTLLISSPTWSKTSSHLDSVCTIKKYKSIQIWKCIIILQATPFILSLCASLSRQGCCLVVVEGPIFQLPLNPAATGCGPSARAIEAANSTRTSANENCKN
jgi:hypothetical protein